MMRVISQSVVPRDITDEFTKAASSEIPLPLSSGYLTHVMCYYVTLLSDNLSLGHRIADWAAGER